MAPLTRRLSPTQISLGRRSVMRLGVASTIVSLLPLCRNGGAVAQTDAPVRALILPKRGAILDRNGVQLAISVPHPQVWLAQDTVDDIDGLLAQLSDIIGLAPATLERLRAAIELHDPSIPLNVSNYLSLEDLITLALQSNDLPGVLPEIGYGRYYPLAEQFAHVVGYAGPVSDYYREQTGDTDPLLEEPDFVVGRLNVEASLEEVLRGQAGVRAGTAENNGDGAAAARQAQRGSDIHLTVDTGLQSYLNYRLRGESAGAVVMDCASGDILALSSTPTFDPNDFVQGVSVDLWNQLNEDPYRPLANKATQGLYPPGATFKMIVGLAAMDAGVLDHSEQIKCHGHADVDGQRYPCLEGGHGNIDLVQALAQSCDVFFYEIAQRVGIDAIADMAMRLGCGTSFDLPFSGIAEGLVPRSAWTQINRGRDWRAADTVSAAIGQGFVLLSPLQLATMAVRIATGRAVEPRLVNTINGVPVPRGHLADLGIGASHLSAVREGMWAVHNDKKGTAYDSRSVDGQYIIAGKTGTSRVRVSSHGSSTAGRMRDRDLPWGERNHALYVGFAPYENPGYAVSVVVEHGGGGAAAAAPIARDILVMAQLRGAL